MSLSEGIKKINAALPGHGISIALLATGVLLILVALSPLPALVKAAILAWVILP